MSKILSSSPKKVLNILPLETVFKQINEAEKFYMINAHEQYNRHFHRLSIHFNYSASENHRGIFCTEDIKAGSNIISSNIYQYVPFYTSLLTRCQVCLSPTTTKTTTATTKIPHNDLTKSNEVKSCEKCNQIVYCSEFCRKSYQSLHNLE